MDIMAHIELVWESLISVQVGCLTGTFSRK